MARYSIALGGNKRNWFWDNLYASANTAGNIKYAAHMMTRHKGPMMEFDGGGHNMQSYYKQEMAGGTPQVNDEFDFVWLNSGTDVRAIYIHNKVAAAGTRIAVQVRDSSTGALVGAATTVDLSTVGFTKVTGGGLLQNNAAAQVVLKAGDLTATCFGYVVDLFTAYSEAPCSCAPVACAVPMPDPTCFNPTPTP